MKKPVVIALSLIIILVFSYIYFTYHYVFHGKVIDADTKKPIEGAAVVASWVKAGATPAGPTTELEDVKETLTDKDGRWIIKGPRGRDPENITVIIHMLTFTYYTRTPTFIVFKPGYCPWTVEAFGINACREKLKPRGSDGFIRLVRGVTVELPNLTNRADRLRALPTPIHLVDRMSEEEVLSKQKNFIRLLNEENYYLGLGELPYLRYLKESKSEK